MSARKLGRGLDSLIRKTEEPPKTVASPEGGEKAGQSTPEIRHLDPRQIRVNRAQPRTHFDDQALRELSSSIKHEGILQPLVVRPDEAGGYELVAGERRLRASLSLGLDVVPAVVQEIEPDRLRRLALIENIQREDLNPIELAVAYRELQKEHDWTQEQLAERLGKKRSSVANALRFLDLEQPIREAISASRLSAGHAKLLLSVEEGKERLEMFEEAITQGWTVRQLDQAIREARGELPVGGSSAGAKTASGSGSSGRSPSTKDASIVAQEEELARALGTKVEIKSSGKRGKIIVDFFNLDDFEKIRRKLLQG